MQAQNYTYQLKKEVNNWEGLILIPIIFIGYVVVSLYDFYQDSTGPKDVKYDEVDIWLHQNDGFHNSDS